MREPGEHLGKLEAGDPKTEGLGVGWQSGSELPPGENLRGLLPLCVSRSSPVHAGGTQLSGGLQPLTPLLWLPAGSVKTIH